MLNEALLLIMEGSRRIGRLVPAAGRHRYADNVRHFLDGSGGRTDPGFIEDQERQGDLRYGAATMRWSGCGPIAAANAVHALGGQAFLPDVIRELARDGAVFLGAGGTSPYAVRDYLAKQGAHVTLSTDESEFDAMLAGGDVFILLFHFDRKKRLNLHYVCLTRQKDGFAVHNLTGRGKAAFVRGNFEEMLAAMTGGKGRSVLLMKVSGTPETG